MSAAPRNSTYYTHRLIVWGILIAGAIVAIVSYREARDAELARAEVEFDRRAALRNALLTEVLNRYDDALFGLSSLFMLESKVTRTEFSVATSRLAERWKGAQAFEWVPLVPAENRVATEEAMREVYPRRDFQIKDFGADGQPVAAAKRPFYYPICYVQPLRGNEEVLGYDIGLAPTRPFLDRARSTRQMVVTSQFRLVQEKGNQLGVVMIWPVFRPRGSGAKGTEDEFIGFLQCVFRVHDLLENAHSRQTNLILDMLFVDASEQDSARRVLYYRPAGSAAPPTPEPSEASFRQGLYREHSILYGGREWRVIYRPRAGWLAAQQSHAPLIRSLGLLLFAGVLAGLVQVVSRRAETIAHEVKERTAELGESRRQFASLLHALPGMAFRTTYDTQLRVVFVSEGAAQLTGWPAEDFIAGKIHFRDIIHPDDLARVREATRTALQERRDVEVEYRLRLRDGGERWVLSRGRGVYAEDGTLRVFEGLAIDITAQKNAESARLELERKLLEGQKLESLGLLAGGIAHDFNNLLSTILGNASMVRTLLPPTAGVDPQLAAIENASLRAADLCRQMLAYAGKGRFVIEPTDLTTLTEDLLPLLKISIGRHATLRLDLARNLPPVLADATQIRQIVMNLVLNAADAIGERPGEITLTTGVLHADHALLAQCVAGAGLAGGEYVFLEVRDNGAGMTPDVIAKIFDPFFTTKFAGRGLGLAAVLGIVRGHHGALRVESAVGRGSGFRLLLPPASLPPPAARQPEARPIGRWKRAGRVLVVEDEEAVRLVTMEMLKTFGLTPTGAVDGEHALSIFRDDPQAFDLILLDVVMPGMDGEHALAAFRQIRPDVRVLFVSGYAEGDILGRLRGSGRLAFLAKPFKRDVLERKLREMLE